MLAEQFKSTMRSLKGRLPFKPFVVELACGERVRVDQPEAVVIRGDVAVFVNVDGAPFIFDHEGVSQIMPDAV